MPKKSSGSKNDNSKDEKEYLSKEEQLELAFKVKCGDQEAWGKLYEAYQKAICGFIRGKTGNPEKSEDFCHDTFIRARRRLLECKYNPTYAFYTFLKLNASNVIENDRKKQSNRRELLEGKKEEKKQSDKKKLLKKKKEAEKKKKKKKKKRLKLIPEPFLTQDDIMLRLDGLEVITICCAKPHQIIAVQFVKFLDIKPREFVGEKDREKLVDLAEEFIVRYSAKYSEYIDEKILNRRCVKLFKKMKHLTKEIYKQKEYKKKLEKYMDNKVEILLFKYFYSKGKKPEKYLHNCCDKVKNRAKKALNEGRGCVESTRKEKKNDTSNG
jgi:hypothetical protein